MFKPYKTYVYRGPVYDILGNCLEPDWYEETQAVSVNQASARLKYKFRNEYGLFVNTPLDLSQGVCSLFSTKEPDEVEEEEQQPDWEQLKLF